MVDQSGLGNSADQSQVGMMNKAKIDQASTTSKAIQIQKSGLSCADISNNAEIVQLGGSNN